jgi:hypothetical protein
MLDSGPKPPNLALRPEPLASPPRYRPVKSCNYIVRMSDGIGGRTLSQSVTVQRYRDRLLVTSANGEEKSTAFISPTGHKFSFNLVDNDGSRLSSDKFSRTVSEAGKPVINNMDLVIPDFIPGPKRAGKPIAWLRDSKGNIQAAFVYRGMSTFRDREVLLLTLVMAPQGIASSRAIGFSIVDKDRAMPMIFALRNGLSIRSELVACID